ncbi:MAG: RluA family pseudouridine synthase [Eubacteriales bacterium]
MKEIHISKNDQGQRYDRFLQKAVPLLPTTLSQKYFRLKRLKCNGKAVKGDYRLVVGDTLQLYINDEFFQKPSPDTAYLSIVKPNISLVYEDEHILLLNKPAGLVVHHDESGESNNLLTHLQAYLYLNKEWKPREAHSFAPALCNRIDRNTSGIVIAAKTATGLREMNDKIKNREVKKEYLAVIHGTLEKQQGKLEDFLLRDKNKKQVYVYDSPVSGGKTAITHYDVLAEHRGLSLVRCELHTGRTHQIRAQFAHMGHPLLGDGKYGDLALDKPYGKKGQALCSYRVGFPFQGEESPLDYLKGKTFQLDDIDFVKKYFPDTVLKKK